MAMTEKLNIKKSGLVYINDEIGFVYDPQDFNFSFRVTMINERHSHHRKFLIRISKWF